jgi:hypothetical protein
MLFGRLQFWSILLRAVNVNDALIFKEIVLYKDCY